MLLDVDGVEVEIREDLFVCIENGNESRFCEWQTLTPDLRKAFLDLKEDLAKKVEEFLHSANNPAFMAISEGYKVNGLEKGCSDRIGHVNEP